MSETKYYFYKFMEKLFFRTLCPRPDRKPYWLSCYFYNLTARIAQYFNGKTKNLTEITLRPGPDFKRIIFIEGCDLK